MKTTIKITFLALIAFAIFGCENQNKPKWDGTEYVKSIEVISPQAIDVQINNEKHIVTINFPVGTNTSNTALNLKLGDGISMSYPETTSFNMDLTKDPFLNLKKNGETVIIQIQTNFIVPPFKPLENGWEKSDAFGELPEYLTVYKHTQLVNSKKVEAYLAVANMNDKAKFTVLGEKKGYKTPKQFYDENNLPRFVINGGYFWDATSLGLVIRDSKTISLAQPMAYRNYNGSTATYYPTQGIFGQNYDGTFATNWGYHIGDNLYTYANPSPNISGEAPQAVPSATFPTAGIAWTPVHAIGAGPILIKGGQYKNLFNYEMLDDAGGIMPESNQPRSAVGYHPDGYLAFFICEGRNMTPETPGLTLKEIADLFLALNCSEVLNLDGGGSSCMLINGKETIKPSDGTPRKITNALVVY